MKNILFHVILLIGFLHPILAQDIKEVKIKKHQSFSSSYSYDGNLLASGGEEELVLIDIPNKAILNRINIGGGIVIKTIFSPDGYHVATASQDGLVRLFKVENGELDKEVATHEHSITSIDFSPSGKYLAVGSADFTVSIWDVWGGKKVTVLKGHSAEVSGVDFSPKGHMLATCGYDGKMKLWNIDGEKYSEIMEVRYGKDKLFDRNDEGRLRDVCFDPEGKKIAVASDDAVIRVFDVENRIVSLFLRGHKDVIFDLEYSSDGAYLFSSSIHGGKVKCWSTETGELVMDIPQAGAYGLSVNNQGTELVISEGDLNQGYLRKIDISELKISASPLMPNFLQEDYLHPKSIQHLFPTQKPKTEIIQPRLPMDGSPVKTTQDRITIKGSVFSENPMRHFIINGKEVDVPLVLDPKQNFYDTLDLAYGNNTVEIKAIDVYGNEVDESFKIQRYVNFKGATDHFDAVRQGVDYALVICTDKYEDDLIGDLQNPVSDGVAIKEILEKDYNYKTEILKNPTKEEIELKMKEYKNKVFADEDQLFIFIAGHGSYDESLKQGYIVTSTSKLSDQEKETYIPHTNLKNMINNIPCDHILLMMDVCFGGTFDDNIAQSDGSRGVYAGFYHPTDFLGEKESFIKEKMSKKSHLFITSGGKTYVPDDNGNGHSPFCSKFLEILKTKKNQYGIITFKKLYYEMEDAIPVPVEGKFGTNGYKSDFLFIGK